MPSIGSTTRAQLDEPASVVSPARPAHSGAFARDADFNSPIALVNQKGSEDTQAPGEQPPDAAPAESLPGGEPAADGSGSGTRRADSDEPPGSALSQSQEIPDQRTAAAPMSAGGAPLGSDGGAPAITAKGGAPPPAASVAAIESAPVRGDIPPTSDVSGSSAASAVAAKPASPLPEESLLRPLETVVRSPAVERFVLARSVINNRPVGALEDIRRNREGVAGVFAFSDVVGMKDEVLYYRWLYEGRQVAKVRVGVWGKRWRSHSSKVLNDNMRGQWRVELRNDQGQLLARSDFAF
jgi:hypothetical protein